MSENPFFNYNIDSLSFLERAEEQLRRFDQQEEVSCLLYAALELRMGIESKLHASLDTANSKSERRSSSNKEYQAKKLLAELLNAVPDAMEESYLSFGLVGSQQRSIFRYAPITKKLAEMHGALGNLLHFSLFNVTEEWFVKKPIDKESKYSLAPYRQLLGAVCEELEKCSSGDLILPVTFQRGGT